MAWHSRLFYAMICATVLLAGAATIVFTQPTPWTGNASSLSPSPPSASRTPRPNVQMATLPRDHVGWLVLFSLMRSRAAP